MGRPKNFSREDVLLKAISVFWEKGFAETSVQDIELATGVNKSGLYSEFANKEDIFLASLEYYLKTRGGDEILSSEPKGWANVERFLGLVQSCYVGKMGCFSVNSMRDVTLFSKEGRQVILRNNLLLRRLLIANIKQELPNSDAGAIADLVLTFFDGLCVEENLHPSRVSVARKIDGFMRSMRHFR